MARYLITNGRKIDVIKQQIIFNGEVTQVRPKTFQLLLQFLVNPQQLIAKQQLLAEVWDDVAVSEQVLFQTIREIRNLFSGEDVISTQPRKGYMWLASVTSVEAEQNSVARDKTKLLMVSVFSLFFLFAVFQLTTFSNNEKLDGSLVVLPVKSEIADNTHNWVYLGAMHQLISRFSSDETLAVLPPELVLHIMSQAELPINYSSADLERIFEVSGANLIVETNLVGAVQDYKLKYNLYFRNETKRGVVFDSSVNGAIDQLANTLTQYVGRNVNQFERSTNSSFASELMVRAVEKRESGEYQASNDLFAGLLVTDKDNVLAHRMMATNYIALKELEKAESSLETAMLLATPSRSDELPIILYFQALIEYIRKDYNESLKLLDKVDVLADQKNNWLYRAFANELKGKIYMKTEQLALAKTSFQSALQHQAIIQCPVGQSQNLLSLSRVAKLSGEQSLALNYLDQATEIIAKRELVFLKQDLAFVKNKVL